MPRASTSTFVRCVRRMPLRRPDRALGLGSPSPAEAAATYARRSSPSRNRRCRPGSSAGSPLREREWDPLPVGGSAHQRALRAGPSVPQPAPSGVSHQRALHEAITRGPVANPLEAPRWLSAARGGGGGFAAAVAIQRLGGSPQLLDRHFHRRRRSRQAWTVSISPESEPLRAGGVSPESSCTTVDIPGIEVDPLEPPPLPRNMPPEPDAPSHL